MTDARGAPRSSPAPWWGSGEDAGVRTVGAAHARWTRRSGRAVGNALEVREAVEVLEGGGPADVVEVTLALAREMLALAGVDDDPAAALRDGRAMDRWRRMVRAQGGDPDAPLPDAPLVEELRTDRAGAVEAIDAMEVGLAAWRLGAGRARNEHPVSPGPASCSASPRRRGVRGAGPRGAPRRGSGAHGGGGARHRGRDQDRRRRRRTGCSACASGSPGGLTPAVATFGTSGIAPTA